MSDAINWSDFIDAIGCDPVAKMTGWIPPADRTQQQQDYHLDTVARMATPFRFVNAMTAAEPDECLSLDMVVKVTGGIGVWPWQLEGSCVGVGGAFADLIAMAGDVLGGDSEEVILPFPFATWGVGRQLGGLRGRGDGSFGGAQIEAESAFGYIAHDDPSVPQGRMVEGHWMKWSSDIELDWSWPPQWPTPKSRMDQIANPQKLVSYAKIETLAELTQAYVQGYGVTQASNWGCESPRVVDGMLVGSRNAKWPHQTWQGGYRKVNGKRYWLWGNQWGPQAHGRCPYLASKYGGLGFQGGVMWIDDANMQGILKEDEVFARSSTGGFPLRNQIDWSSITW